MNPMEAIPVRATSKPTPAPPPPPDVGVRSSRLSLASLALSCPTVEARRGGSASARRLVSRPPGSTGRVVSRAAKDHTATSDALHSRSTRRKSSHCGAGGRGQREPPRSRSRTRQEAPLTWYDVALFFCVLACSTGEAFAREGSALHRLWPCAQGHCGRVAPSRFPSPRTEWLGYSGGT